MNTKNANSAFRDICSADWRLHWTWSIFFRNVWLCDRLQYHNRVIEIGSADSMLHEYLRDNYKWKGEYFRYDINADDYPGVAYGDIVKGIDMPNRCVSAVVMAEVIEHIHPDHALKALENAYDLIDYDGNLYLTTPTPLKDEGMELVWPESHDHEYSLPEIRELLRMWFNIAEEFPWHSRKVPEGYDNGMFGTFAKAYKTLTIPIEEATQVAFTLEKR